LVSLEKDGCRWSGLGVWTSPVRCERNSDLGGHSACAGLLRRSNGAPGDRVPRCAIDDCLGGKPGGALGLSIPWKRWAESGTLVNVSGRAGCCGGICTVKGFVSREGLGDGRRGGCGGSMTSRKPRALGLGRLSSNDLRAGGGRGRDGEGGGCGLVAVGTFGGNLSGLPGGVLKGDMPSSR
jgi:hypothetical protein